MKYFRLLGLLLYSLIFTEAYAKFDSNDEMSTYINYQTYMGVNYKYNWIRPKGDWAKLFVKTHPGFNVYFGWRFHPSFSAELGYEWTDHKPLTAHVPTGGSLLNLKNTTGHKVDLEGRIRFKTGYIDFNGFIPFPIQWNSETLLTPEVIISAGFAGMKPDMKIVNPAINPLLDDLTIPPQFTVIQGRSKAVLRLGLGLQMLMSDSVGARILWRFERTAVLRGRNSRVVTDPRTRDIFHDGQSVAMGLFYNFY